MTASVRMVAIVGALAMVEMAENLAEKKRRVWVMCWRAADYGMSSIYSKK